MLLSEVYLIIFIKPQVQILYERCILVHEVPLNLEVHCSLTVVKTFVGEPSSQKISINIFKNKSTRRQIDIELGIHIKTLPEVLRKYVRRNLGSLSKDIRNCVGGCLVVLRSSFRHDSQRREVCITRD